MHTELEQKTVGLCAIPSLLKIKVQDGQIQIPVRSLPVLLTSETPNAPATLDFTWFFKILLILSQFKHLQLVP